MTTAAAEPARRSGGDTLTTATKPADIDTFAAALALVAHSQIVVPAATGEGAAGLRPLPAGFDEVDVAILEWIAAEGRRLGRGFARL